MNYSLNIFYYKLLFVIIFLFNVIIFNFNDLKTINPTNIPEINYYNNQSLHLLVQSNKCYSTLFLLSDYRIYNKSFNIMKINLKNKNYFITYFESDYVYKEYNELLQKQGIIKSNYKYGKHNLFMSKLFGDYFTNNNYNIYDLDKFQKVYRFYGSYNAFRKNSLYEFYAEMKKKFYQDFDYMPETYIYPEQKKVIYEKFRDYKLDFNDLWLVKPKDKAGGVGIKLFSSMKKLEKREFVITKCITSLNLINGKKYDLRIHVLIAGLKPLRIYLYDEGFVKIATEKYSLDKNLNISKYVYLTNHFVNKHNINYINPKTINDYNSNFYTILMYKRYLKSINIEYSDIIEKIKDIIIKSIISVYRNLTEENEKMNISDLNFFNLLGYDFLITDKFEPILCEINYNPSMEIHNNVEKENKTNLFVDTLNLIGIVPYSKKTKEPLNMNLKYIEDIKDSINNAFCELERPRGGYELIFPKKENIIIYKKYFVYNTEENKIFWSKLTS